MSYWAAPLCHDCWDRLNPENPSDELGYDLGPEEVCDECGKPTRSGIYLRRERKLTKEALLEMRLAKMRATPQCHASSKQDGGHSLSYRNYGERCGWCGEKPDPEGVPKVIARR